MRINKQGGYLPITGGPPVYRPNRGYDFPDIPEPLMQCSRCDHAALFGPDDRGNYYCAHHIGRVDIFHANMVSMKSAIQMRADLALEKRTEKKRVRFAEGE